MLRFSWVIRSASRRERTTLPDRSYQTRKSAGSKREAGLKAAYRTLRHEGIGGGQRPDGVINDRRDAQARSHLNLSMTSHPIGNHSNGVGFVSLSMTTCCCKNRILIGPSSPNGSCIKTGPQRELKSRRRRKRRKRLGHQAGL